MISWLLGLLNPLNGIISAISNAKIAQINATSDVQKAQIQAQIDSLESKRDVLIADAQTSKWDVIVRACLTIPLIVYFNKVIIYDKVIGSWPNYSTDYLGPNEILVYAVLGFYFLYSTAKLFR